MLKNFHPRSAAIYLAVWFLLAMFIAEVKTLLLMTGLAAAMNLAEDRGKALGKTLAFILPLTLFIIGFNLLLADYGQSVLCTFRLPGAGEITIYREPVLSSVGMGVRLILLLSIFSVFNLVITADHLFSIFGSFSGPLVLMIVLARRMVPALGSQAHAIAEAQSLRLGRTTADNLPDKVKLAGPFLTNLLRATLESSFKTAEAMQLRAYGGGTRTFFVPEKWRGRDTFLTAASLATLVLYGGISCFPALTLYGAALPVLLAGSQLTGRFSRRAADRY